MLALKVTAATTCSNSILFLAGPQLQSPFPVRKVNRSYQHNLAHAIRTPTLLVSRPLHELRPHRLYGMILQSNILIVCPC
jgi:hypothetical protein